MSKEAFDRIAQGLREALDVARGSDAYEVAPDGSLRPVVPESEYYRHRMHTAQPPGVPTFRVVQ